MKMVKEGCEKNGKNSKLKIHFISILPIILILLTGNIVSSSFQQQILIYVSSFGFLALLSIIFVLSIPVLVKLKRNNFTISLFANRRWVGIYTFVFALIHVFLVYHFFFNWDLSKITEDSNRLFGTIAFLILAAMAATSNETSVKILGKNWKRLHYLIYAVLILAIIHSFNVGLIFMKNTLVQIVIVLSVVFVIFKAKVDKRNVSVIGAPKKERQKQKVEKLYEYENKNESCRSCNYEFASSFIFEKGAKTMTTSCPNCQSVIEKKITNNVLKKSKEL